MRGWPGETGSPSSTSHSSTVPPCSAKSFCSSRRETTVTTCSPRAQLAALDGPAALDQCRRTGRPAARQVEAALSGSCTGSACLATNSRAASSWSGVLSAKSLHALEVPLGDAGQRAGRRHLEDAGDAQFAHGVHAKVPADRVGDLPHDPVHDLAAGADHPAVAVGDVAHPRVAYGDALGQLLEPRHGRGHVLGVEGAGHRQSRRSRAFSGPSASKAVSCSAVPAATIWPGPLSLAGVSPYWAILASTSSRSPPRTAVIEVSGDRGGRGHGPAALADQGHRGLGGDRAGAGGGGQLPDGVPGGGADLAERVRRVREQGEGRGETGRDQQRLGDRGVADGVGVRLGAVVHQVEIGDGRPPGEPVGDAGDVEPGSEEAGGLGTLAGSDEYEHPSTFPRTGRRGPPRRARRSWARPCGIPTRASPPRPVVPRPARSAA